MAATARSMANVVLKHQDAVLDHLHDTVSNEDVKHLCSSSLLVDSGDWFAPEICSDALQQFHMKSLVEASLKAAQSWRKPSWKPRPPKTHALRAPGAVFPL